MKQVFGSILMAVGILIAGASGLCSLLVIGGGLSEPGVGDFLEMLGIVLLVGGIPFGIGLAAFFGGRALVHQAKSEVTKATAGTPQEPREQEPTATPSQENQ